LPGQDEGLIWRGAWRLANVRILGHVTAKAGYAGLIEIFRNRIEELGTQMACIDDLACLPDGYVAKVLAPIMSRLGHKNGRIRLGMTSLGGLMQVLGIELVAIAVEPDRRLQQRQAGGAKIENSARTPARTLLSKKRRLNAHKQNLLRPTIMRSNIARLGGVKDSACAVKKRLSLRSAERGGGCVIPQLAQQNRRRSPIVRSDHDTPGAPS
jgi:hypothetical protein